MLERRYTTKEIAQQSGYCEETVRNLCRHLGFTSEIESKNSRQPTWSYIAYKAVMNWKKKQDEKRASFAPVKKEEQLSIEELRKLHPLVKDDRFFKTSFFPDVTPKCFEELEDD